MTSYSSCITSVIPPSCTMNRNRIVSLSLLGQYINCVTEQAAECGVPVTVLGEKLSLWFGICFSITVSKCQSFFYCYASHKLIYNDRIITPQMYKLPLVKSLLVEELSIWKSIWLMSKFQHDKGQLH